jgi:flagellin
MDVLGSAGPVLQNQALTQNRLLTDVNALASGLRVRSASDDPSGYTIAETIQTKVAGLQQSVTNVQTANNLLNVADGALNSVTLILQRIRSLVVESNSSVNSSQDIQNIQSEINQLLLEINRISENTNFNGLTLFTGAFDTGQSALTHGQEIIAVPSPILAPDGSSGSNELVDSQIDTKGNVTGTTGPGPFIEPTLQNTQDVPSLIVFQVQSYATVATDPDSGFNESPGDYVVFESYSQDPRIGVAPLYIDTSALQVGLGGIQTQYNAPPAFGGGAANVLLDFAIGNLSPQDVGATAAFEVLAATNTTPPTGHALSVNDGGEEGQTIAIDLPQINTSTLNISDIDIDTPETENFMNQLTGPSSSNALAAADAELRLDTALESVNSIRAQVGAQTVALQNDADNDNTAVVNLGATVSNIRDANIGQTTTDYTRQQILVSVGDSVLSQINVHAQQLTALLLNSFSGLPT